ncbi:MAG: VWA domain-containing protein [Phycisphaerales bacterium]|nr:MAG: VWA domain-containing protein [Phycisphaerales bacterium]
MVTGTLAALLEFIHPHLAIGALAAGLIPVIIHLINRRRYRRMPWAAMSFLLAASRRSIRRMRMEQWWLLLIRVAAIILFCAAVARPYMAASSLPFLGTVRSHHAILLDNSRSMNAVNTEGVSRFERARKAAEMLIASFPETDAISLITLAHPAEAVIEYGSYDRRFVRERLASVRPTQRITDTAGALTEARRILKDSDVAEGNRAVYLVSDLPSREWGTGSEAAASATIRAGRQLTGEADFTVLRIGDEEGGLALTSLMCESSLIGVNAPVRVLVETTNLSKTRARECELRLQKEGQILRAAKLPPIAPGESVLTSLPATFASPGTYTLTARLLPRVADALEDDNERYLSVEVRDTAPVLLVDGRPGSVPLDGQAGYLSTALAPRVNPTDNTLIEPKLITELELESEALTDYDAVVLCNVQRLSPEQWRHLQSFVFAGGGVILFMGDLVNVDNYNRLGYAEGAGLLPGQLGERRGGSEGEPFTTFKNDELRHPVVSEFADLPDSGLFLARVNNYLSINADPRRAEVVLRYANNDPAIVVSDMGLGRVAVVTTTANTDWTNLPAKGDYVSLMRKLEAYVCPPYGERRNVLVGEAAVEPLSPAQASLSLRVTTADGRIADGKLVPQGESLAMRYGPIEQAGALTFAIGSDLVRFAANVDPIESELTPAAESAVRAALGEGVRFLTEESDLTAPTTTGKSSEWATTMLYMVLCLLLYESLTAMRFSAER